MNEYDSDKMLDVLAASDTFARTEQVEEADVILFNTCSVREKAQEKVFSDLGRVKHLKQRNPNLLIGVGGCVASQEGENIVRRAPYVDLVFGPQTLHRLPLLIAQRRATGHAQVDISFPEIEKFDHLPLATVTRASAFVSIMEGCSKYCSFCVVPYTRGEEVSRPFDDVLTEVVDLVSQGVREITLLGQNVNAYRGVISDVDSTESDIADLALLLEYIHAIDGLERIRYITSHPKEMSARLIDSYRRLPKLVSHLHLPVQSGSDRVLAAMKRGYTALEYKSIVRRLRQARPDICLSSDFIVGFPGESEDDFAATMKLIDDVAFDASYSFVYSRRPGTPAAELADEVSESTKLARLQRLQAKLDQLAYAVSSKMLHTVQRVLVEGVSRRGQQQLASRTDNNRIVNFSGSEALLNQFVEVKISEVLAHTLKGELVSSKVCL